MTSPKDTGTRNDSSHTCNCFPRSTGNSLSRLIDMILLTFCSLVCGGSSHVTASGNVARFSVLIAGSTGGQRFLSAVAVPEGAPVAAAGIVPQVTPPLQTLPGSAAG